MFTLLFKAKRSVPIKNANLTKAHIKTYTKVSPTGKLETVKEHEDARPSAQDHGSHEDEPRTERELNEYRGISGQADIGLSDTDRAALDEWTETANSTDEAVLLSVFRKLPKFTGIVYRGLVLNDDDLRKLMMAKVYTLKGFASSSKDLKTAELFLSANKNQVDPGREWNVLLQVDVRDAPYIGTQSLYPDQEEVVLKKTRYSIKFHSVDPNNRRAKFELTQL